MLKRMASPLNGVVRFVGVRVIMVSSCDHLNLVIILMVSWSARPGFNLAIPVLVWKACLE